MFRSIGFPELIVLSVVFFFIWPFWRIFTKAGYPGPMGIMMVPGLNAIMLLFLAFSEWSVLKELKALKQHVPALP